MPNLNSRLVVLACSAAVLSIAIGSASARPLIVCTESSPTSLNAGLSWSSTAADVGAQMYNKLIEIERGGSALVPGLAQSYDISADGLTYTFHLRNNVKWHSNETYSPTRDFNADDVLFTFDRYMNEANKFHGVGQNEYFEYMGFNKQITGIKKVNQLTIEVKLIEPNSTFLATLANDGLPIQSAEYADHVAAAGLLEAIDNKPIGTGPFQFVAYQVDTTVRFKKFPDYWAIAAGQPDRAAKIDDLIFAVTSDPAVRMIKIKAGECDVAPYPNSADVADLLQHPDPNIELYSQPGIDYSILSYNTEKKPFDDQRVREALSMAIDRNAILKAVYLDITGTPANSPIMSPLWGRADIKPVKYDPEAAKKALTEAGYPEGFRTSLWSMPVSRPYMPNSHRAAELIQADLANIGVTAEIKTFEWGEYLKRMRGGEHDMAILGWILDYAHPNAAVDGQFNCAAKAISNSRWCTEVFDKLFNEARQEVSPEKAAPLYVEMQQIIRRELPGYFIANSVSYLPVRKSVIGFKKQSFGGQPYWGVELSD